MTAKKTLSEREAELRSLLATPAGRGELEALASRYAAAVGRLLPGLGPLVNPSAREADEK